ncbi:MAG: transglutaminase-like domain-containing protein [Oscillospiraceae bacterium]|nr:transglutaminase-like domain-containing protein [Oscillospiraceae bacterium]
MKRLKFIGFFAVIVLALNGLAEAEISASSAAIPVPKASGTKISQNDKSAIDYSNANDGYIMVKYTGTRTRAVVYVNSPGKKKYQYELPVDKKYHVLPLTEGDGKYTIEVLEATGNTGSVIDKLEITVKLSDALKPFLNPNYYVNFNKNSTVTKKANELCSGKKTEVEKISAVYNWFVSEVVYDHEKAKNVKSGYVPKIADLMKDKKGICFDYASAMTAMLRSQGIPARLEVGYAGEEYHAWISVFTKETGWVNGWIQFDGKNWKLMDPTYAAANKENSGFRKFMNTKGSYSTIYKY